MCNFLFYFFLNICFLHKILYFTEFFFFLLKNKHYCYIFLFYRLFTFLWFYTNSFLYKLLFFYIYFYSLIYLLYIFNIYTLIKYKTNNEKWLTRANDTLTLSMGVEKKLTWIRPKAYWRVHAISMITPHSHPDWATLENIKNKKRSCTYVRT